MLGGEQRESRGAAAPRGRRRPAAGPGRRRRCSSAPSAPLLRSAASSARTVASPRNGRSAESTRTPLRRRVPQPGVRARPAARRRRVLARPGHGARGGPGAADDDGGAGVGTGGEHPVEQRPAAHPHAGLVRAAEPPGGAPGEHDGVVRGRARAAGRARARSPPEYRRRPREGTRTHRPHTARRQARHSRLAARRAHSVRSSTAGCSTQSATYRRKPPAVPPSHTRWSKVSESWTTCRTASSPSCTQGLGDDPADAEHGRLGVVDDRRGAVDPEHPVVVQREGAAGELAGVSVPARAASVSRAISALSDSAFRVCASRTTGTTRPRSVCAAKPEVDAGRAGRSPGPPCPRWS